MSRPFKLRSSPKKGLLGDFFKGKGAAGWLNPAGKIGNLIGGAVDSESEEGGGGTGGGNVKISVTVNGKRLSGGTSGEASDIDETVESSPTTYKSQRRRKVNGRRINRI